jgi:hypothetical protein
VCNLRSRENLQRVGPEIAARALLVAHTWGNRQMKGWGVQLWRAEFAEKFTGILQAVKQRSPNSNFGISALFLQMRKSLQQITP